MSVLMLSYLIHFEWIFAHREKLGTCFSHLYVHIQFSKHTLLKRLSFSNVYFWHFCQDSDGWSTLGLFLHNISYFFGQKIFFFTHTMLFWLLWLCSTVWGQVLWYRQHYSSALDFLPIQGLSCFHMNFSIFSIYIKNVIGILIGNFDPMEFVYGFS
jgi:hypothetical protein